MYNIFYSNGFTSLLEQQNLSVISMSRMPSQGVASLSQKNIIFRFKDSKIVKSRRSNRYLQWRTDEELAEELRKAFRFEVIMFREQIYFLSYVI